MLETCRGGPRPIRLCVEKTKSFGQIQPPRTWSVVAQWLEHWPLDLRIVSSIPTGPPH